MPFDSIPASGTQTIHPSVSANLSPRVINALLEIEHGLRNGRYKHFGYYNQISMSNEGCDPGLRRDHLFSMAMWSQRFSCGTVRCIGGDLIAILRRELTEAENVFCNALFFPLGVQAENLPLWRRITPVQAAEAIRNFIATAEPHWSEVVYG